MFVDLQQSENEKHCLIPLSRILNGNVSANEFTSDQLQSSLSLTGLCLGARSDGFKRRYSQTTLMESALDKSHMTNDINCEFLKADDPNIEVWLPSGGEGWSKTQAHHLSSLYLVNEETEAYGFYFDFIAHAYVIEDILLMTGQVIWQGQEDTVPNQAYCF